MNIKDILKDVETFLNTLSTEVAADSNDGSAREHTWFSKAGHGTVHLNREEDAAFRSLVDALYTSQSTARRRTVTRKTMGTWLQDAIFEALGPVENASGRATLAAGAVTSLKTKLKSPAVDYEVYLPISGVKAASRSRNFGAVTLCHASTKIIARLRKEGERIINAGRSSPEVKVLAAKELGDDVDQLYGQRTISTVIVRAVDRDSAALQALDIVRDTVDVINFCAVMLVPREVTAYASVDELLPSRDAPLMFRERSVLHFPQQAPRRAIDLDSLFTREAQGVGARKVSRLLKSRSLNLTEKRLLAAIRWTGRGNALPRPSESLVAYLIALEALLLPPNKEGEIGQRLRLRAAHVIGRDRQTRKRVFDRLGALYGVRSKVVHSGLRELENHDLGDARVLAQRAVTEVLLGRRFASREFDLEKWFIHHALR